MRVLDAREHLLGAGPHDQRGVALSGVLFPDQVRMHVHESGQQGVPGQVDAPSIGGRLIGGDHGFYPVTGDDDRQAAPGMSLSRVEDAIWHQDG